MLHAKDIMVGDWVILYGSLTRWGYTDYAKWHNEMERTDIHAVEPVRITPEILEKNGFTRFGTDYILEGEHFRLENPSDPRNYLDNYWLRISLKAVHIEYAHELQHALRLCGIEKEIEL